MTIPFAKVLGWALIVPTLLLAASNIGIQTRLIVPGDATETVRNTLANEALFCLGVVLEMNVLRGSSGAPHCVVLDSPTRWRKAGFAGSNLEIDVEVRVVCAPEFDRVAVLT